MAISPITPGVGRIVLFVPNPSRMETYKDRFPIPAIITAVHKNDTVNLQAFRNDHGSVFKKCVDYSEAKEMDTWHWPPRV